MDPVVTPGYQGQMSFPNCGSNVKPMSHQARGMKSSAGSQRKKEATSGSTTIPSSVSNFAFSTSGPHCETTASASYSYPYSGIVPPPPPNVADMKQQTHFMPVVQPVGGDQQKSRPPTASVSQNSLNFSLNALFPEMNETVGQSAKVTSYAVPANASDSYPSMPKTSGNIFDYHNKKAPLPSFGRSTNSSFGPNSALPPSSDSINNAASQQAAGASQQLHIPFTGLISGKSSTDQVSFSFILFDTLKDN
jgi:hypothetical protein